MSQNTMSENNILCEHINDAFIMAMEFGLNKATKHEQKAYKNMLRQIVKSTIEHVRAKQSNDFFKFSNEIDLIVIE